MKVIIYLMEGIVVGPTMRTYVGRRGIRGGVYLHRYIIIVRMRHTEAPTKWKRPKKPKIMPIDCSLTKMNKEILQNSPNKKLQTRINVPD